MDSKHLLNNLKPLTQRILTGQSILREEALQILESSEDALLALLDAAFEVRRRYFGRGVRLHVLRNAQSGQCSEDCQFCSQSASSRVPIESYPLQSAEEIIHGARAAHQLGAVRYCIVISGRHPRPDCLDKICAVVRLIKQEIPIQICTSLGLLNQQEANQLRAAGVDRYNHNLETSERFFSSICTTHSYADRLATVRAVKAAGLALCSGGLLGMGETLQDRVDLAFALRDVAADSIPVNFLDPRPGTGLDHCGRLSPSDCLRALVMFRLVNPDREVRLAGGREACLGALQALALFPANSMFTNGYLTTPGQGYSADMAMLKAAGFHIAEITQAG